MTMRVIYLRVLFGFEMSEVHLQILLSGGVDCRARRRPGAGEGRGPSPCINLYSYVSE